jgi:hypothetical protein
MMHTGTVIRRAMLLCSLICLVSFIAACGYHEGIVQKADRSYLKFKGNWENASVQVDDSSPFVLVDVMPAGSEKRETDGVLYELSPGRHALKVFREGNIVVDRIVILESQTTKEVFIP